MHNYSIPINGKIRVQITQAQPNSESAEIPSTHLQGLWISLGGVGFYFIEMTNKCLTYITEKLYKVIKIEELGTNE